MPDAKPDQPRFTGGGTNVTKIDYTLTGGGTRVTKYVVGEPPEDADPDDDTQYIRIVRTESEPAGPPQPYVPSAESLARRKDTLAKIAAQLGKPIKHADPFEPVDLDGNVIPRSKRGRK